jgi:hypothetical protein
MARHRPDVELDARVSARELRVLRTAAPWEVSAVGLRPQRDTRRRNIPEKARPGETFEDVEIEINRAVQLEEDRGGSRSSPKRGRPRRTSG